MDTITRRFELFKGSSMYSPENQMKLVTIIENVTKLVTKLATETNPDKKNVYRGLLSQWYDTLLELNAEDSFQFNRDRNLADMYSREDWEWQLEEYDL